MPGKIEMIFFGGQSEIRATADERLLLQIVANLVTNAIKFTPEGGTVRLFVSANQQKGIVIKVADTGIGIAPENIDRVLRPFEQVETSYARKHGGSGLGLPYAKRLTELHGGNADHRKRAGKGHERVRHPARVPPCRGQRSARPSRKPASRRLYGLRTNRSRTRSVLSVSVHTAAGSRPAVQAIISASER